MNIITGDAKELADIALKNRLYVSGWDLSGKLKKIRAGKSIGVCYHWIAEHVVLAFDGNTPVGVCIALTREKTKYRDEYVEIQIFVRKSMRNQGIGSSMLTFMKTLFPAGTTFSAGWGAAHSKHMFAKFPDVEYS